MACIPIKIKLKKPYVHKPGSHLLSKGVGSDRRPRLIQIFLDKLTQGGMEGGLKF